LRPCTTQTAPVHCISLSLSLSLSLLPLCVSRASRDTGTRARRRVTVSLRLRHSRTPPHKGPERAHIPVCCCIACQSRDGTWVEATSPVVTTGIIRVSSHQSQNTDVPHTPRELDARGLVNWMPSLACHIQAKALRYHCLDGKGQLAHASHTLFLHASHTLFFRCPLQVVRSKSGKCSTQKGKGIDIWVQGELAPE